MKYLKSLALIAGLALTGCVDFLDIMPDNVATMEHAFSNRTSTEKFLFSCYNFLPNHATTRYPGMICGDEIWWIPYGERYDQSDMQVALGNQNANNPSQNFWDGDGGTGKNLFIALRDCNIFLENIHVPGNIEEWERQQWIAEVKVLKAYFHFFLLQLYGPIPIIRNNLPINAEPSTTLIYREPVDDVVNYIVELIDEAMPDLLPNSFETRAVDAGRITLPIAAALKAKALVLAASPLFNGNPDYVDFKDNRGVQLIATEYDSQKWERAAQAAGDAIRIAQENGHALYEYQYTPGATALSPVTLLKATLRGAITEKYNEEIIWPSPMPTNGLEMSFVPYLYGLNGNVHPNEWGPTLNVVEQFYTQNGLPVDEDAEWLSWMGNNFALRYEPLAVSSNASSGWDGVSSLSDDHRYYIESNGTTARLHFYREPRFYAWVGFDRSIWELNGVGETNRVIRMRNGELNGAYGQAYYNPCGFLCKKFVHPETIQDVSLNFYQVRYTFPIIRLTDLYLLYAESLNEMKQTPDAEVYEWIDPVRKRAGIPGVLEAYEKALPGSRNKPLTKEGMREIIKRERMIELSFESQRFFDILRWKDGLKYFNEPIKGWNMSGNSIETFYRIITIWDKRDFNTKDYLWPIKTYNLQVNSNLVQNPGW